MRGMAVLSLLLGAGGMTFTGPLGYLVADVTPTLVDQAPAWAGGAVLVGVAFARGWIVGGPSHNRVVAERDKALAQLEERNREDRELLMPLLAKNAQAALRVVEQRTTGREGDG
jgi:hypothetical protein